MKCCGKWMIYNYHKKRYECMFCGKKYYIRDSKSGLVIKDTQEVLVNKDDEDLFLNGKT